MHVYTYVIKSHSLEYLMIASRNVWLFISLNWINGGWSEFFFIVLQSSPSVTVGVCGEWRRPGNTKKVTKRFAYFFEWEAEQWTSFRRKVGYRANTLPVLVLVPVPLLSSTATILSLGFYCCTFEGCITIRFLCPTGN